MPNPNINLAAAPVTSRGLTRTRRLTPRLATVIAVCLPTVVTSVMTARATRPWPAPMKWNVKAARTRSAVTPTPLMMPNRWCAHRVTSETSSARLTARLIPTSTKASRALASRSGGMSNRALIHCEATSVRARTATATAARIAWAVLTTAFTPSWSSFARKNATFRPTELLVPRSSNPNEVVSEPMTTQIP